MQFLEQDAARPEADDSGLRREAVRRTLGKAVGLDFNRVIDRKGLATVLFVAAAAVGVGVTLVALDPAQAGVAVARFADPFGDRDWPRQTQLEVEAPRTRIGRNELFEVHAKVSGVLPRTAQVVFRSDRQSPIEHVVDVVRGEDGVGRLTTRLPGDRVQRDFTFQVRANDALSKVYEITVLPPPVLVPLGPEEPSPSIRLDLPTYTGLPTPQQLPPGSGAVEAVAGTRVSLRARANRPLRRAWIEYLPEPAYNWRLLGFAPLGGSNPIGVVAGAAGGSAVWDSVEAVLEPDRCTFTADFTPHLRGDCAIHFEDETGLAGVRLLGLAVQSDPAPTVTLERPAPATDLLSVLPKATLTLQAVVDDPRFGIRSVFLEYRTANEENPRRLPLYDLAAVGRSGAVGGAFVHASSKVRPEKVEVQRPLALAALTHLDGSPLREGDVLRLAVAADDFDDVFVNKAPGRSHEVEVRIVGRAKLDLALNQEQARVQQELLRLREKERDALKKTLAVEKDVKQNKKLTPEQLDALLQAEQLQQQIREQVGTPKEGLRAQVERVLETARQNGLTDSGVRETMGELSRELERIATRELEAIETKLATARQKAEQQEDKTRPEDRARREALAGEKERQAKAAEDSARAREAEAAKAAADAAKTTDPAVKKQRAEDERKAREKAEADKARARELKQDAERDRREASGLEVPAQTREALAEARSRQEEVEKTFNDLLNRLEPYEGSREIKGETGRLVEEQEKLAADLADLNDKKHLEGKPANELNDNQKSELDNARDNQKRLEERTQQLFGKMQRVADARKKDDDVKTARELEDALTAAREGNINGKMKEAAEAIANNQLGKAEQHQKDAAAELKKVLKNMEDRREAEMERLTRKLRKDQQELENLTDEQERLQKKIKEAEQIGDPGKREEALKALHRQQQELQKKAEELLKRLSRDRAGRAGQALAKAGEQMEEAAKQLSGGQPADEQQEGVLDRLDEAERELEQSAKEAEDQLAREQRARVADVLKRLRERQEALGAESTRVQKAVRTALQNQKPTRGLIGDSWKNLGVNQRGLADETAETASKELSAAVVFARTIRRAAEAMNLAADRLDEVRTQLPAPEALPDVEAERLHNEALRRLDQVLDALKSDEGSGPRLAKQNEGGQEGGDEGGGGGGDDGLPATGELKLLRKLQKEINDRTEAFVKEHPDLTRLDDKDKAALQELRRDQQDVAELLEAMRNPDEKPAADGKPGDPK